MQSQGTEQEKSWHSQTHLVCDRRCVLVNSFFNIAFVTTCPMWQPAPVYPICIKKFFLKFEISSPHKKTSLGESLAGSHAYNPIRDSRQEPWRDFLARQVSPTISPRVSPRVLPWVLPRLSVRLLARLLSRLFASKRLAESLGSDYMHDSQRNSLRDPFFLRGRMEKKRELWIIRKICSVAVPRVEHLKEKTNVALISSLCPSCTLSRARYPTQDVASEFFF